MMVKQMYRQLPVIQLQEKADYTPCRFVFNFTFIKYCHFAGFMYFVK